MEYPNNFMRVLVCGASGLLGRQLYTLLEGSDGFECVGTGRVNTLNGKLIRVNLCKLDDVEELFCHKFDVCVNCVAERRVDVCEANWGVAKESNIDTAAAIASACVKFGVRLIHLSTDYVFDGRSSPYSTDSVPNPLQNYGISKLIAEFRVKTINPTALIIRVPVLYSSGTKLSESAVTSVFRTVLDQTNATELDASCPRHPVYVPDFCAFLKGEIQVPSASGIIHYSSDATITKFEMARMAADYLRKPLLAIPISSPPGASRPIDTQFAPPHDQTLSFRAAMIQCLQPFWHPKVGSDRGLVLVVGESVADAFKGVTNVIVKKEGECAPDTTGWTWVVVVVGTELEYASLSGITGRPPVYALNGCAPIDADVFRINDPAIVLL